MSRKKILENPLLGSIVVPIAVVLVGSLIIMGLMRMLSTERTYRDLVQEMQTKTFGNRWVAALELSKVLANKQVPQEDIPWLVGELEKIFASSDDSRTRNFIVLALSSLQTEKATPLFLKAIDDGDPKVQFNALFAIGNSPRQENISWAKVLPFLESDDPGLQEVAIYVLSTHKVLEAEVKLEKFLTAPNRRLRYAASTGLISFQNKSAMPVLIEILLLGNAAKQGSGKKAEEDFNASQIEVFKLNVLNAVQRMNWKEMLFVLETWVSKETNIKIATKAQEVIETLR